ncbi:MAG: hypothetical protein INR73_15725 [Williamsia sp.]|nr:hypothetical protein [Williamsia sp.]
MFHLLKIEWLKVKNYRTFWILLALVLISIPALNYMIFDLTDNSFGQNGKQVQRMLLGRPFSFPLVWQTTGWLSSLVLFIPSLLIITLTTNEFTYKTHRQNIINGLSRVQFISVKMVEVLLLALLTTILVFISAFWIGHVAAEPTETVRQFANTKQLGYFFVEALSYIMFSFLLSVMIKRAGLVMGLFFLYSMIGEQIAVVVMMRFANDIGRFLPLETSDRLILNPFSRLISTPEAIKKWQNEFVFTFSRSIAYVLLYAFICIWYFRKRDL